MSIQAKLLVDDRTYNVLECQFAFKKQYNHMGLPSSYTNFKSVKLVIEATRDNLFWEWAISPTECKQAELHFTPRIEGTKSRKLQLIDTYCVRNRMHFLSHGSIPMTETIELACGGFRDLATDIEFSTHWRKTFPVSSDAEVITQSSLHEPQLLDCYITDVNGTTLDSYKTGDTIILNVKTENYIGEDLTINLNDKTHDFEHNGNVLENDTLKDYIISSNLEQIPLKVIPQTT